jgi:hypothetical protein
MNSIVNQLNIAVTRRNIARRQGNVRIMVWWERQARYFAGRLHTKLVELPGRPGAIVPEIWSTIL